MAGKARAVVVSLGDPPTSLVNELVQRGISVVASSFADAEEEIEKMRPDLVVLDGVRGAMELSTLLDDPSRPIRPRLAIVAEGKELSRLRGLNRDIVVALLSKEMTERVVVERLETIARKWARIREESRAPELPLIAAEHASRAPSPSPALEAPPPDLARPVDAPAPSQGVKIRSPLGVPPQVSTGPNFEALADVALDAISSLELTTPRHVTVGSKKPAPPPDADEIEELDSLPPDSLEAEPESIPLVHLKSPEPPVVEPTHALGGPAPSEPRTVPRPRMSAAPGRASPRPGGTLLGVGTPAPGDARPLDSLAPAPLDSLAAPPLSPAPVDSIRLDVGDLVLDEVIPAVSSAHVSSAHVSSAHVSPAHVSPAHEPAAHEPATPPPLPVTEAARHADTDEAPRAPTRADDLDPRDSDFELEMPASEREFFTDEPVLAPLPPEALAPPKKSRAGVGIGLALAALLGVGGAAAFGAIPGVPALVGSTKSVPSEAAPAKRAANTPIPTKPVAEVAPPAAEKKPVPVEPTATPPDPKAPGSDENPFRIEESTQPACEKIVPESAEPPGDRLHVASEKWRLARDSIVKGNLDDARLKMCEAVILHPESAALEGLALLAVTRNAPTEALGWIERALAARPDERETKNLRGDALSQLGESESALGVWLEALNVKPEETARRRQVAKDDVTIGRRQLKQGDLPRADRLLRRAATLDPESPIAFTGLAEVAFRLGRLPAARTFALRAIELFPANPDAYLVLGDIAVREGNPSLARTHFERALQVRSDFWAARVRLRELGPASEAPASP